MTRAPRITKATGRSVSEWSSDNPDAKVPPAVRLRILRRYDSKCQLSGLIIADGQPFDLEHVKALEEGGAHAESNLVPVLRLPHELKTAAERKRQAKADRIAKAGHHMNPVDSKPIQSAPFPPVKPKERSDRSAKIDKAAVSNLGASNIARRFANG